MMNPTVSKNFYKDYKSCEYLLQSHGKIFMKVNVSVIIDFFLFTLKIKHDFYQITNF